MSSSLTILMTCCAGLSAWETSAPPARSFIALMNTRTTGRATSASSSAMRISRAVASMSASVSRPLPRRPVKTLSRRSGSVPNTARPRVEKSGHGAAAPPHPRVTTARPALGRLAQRDCRDDVRVGDEQRGAAVGAGPLGALAAVLGVAVDARRLHEVAVVAAGRAGPGPALHEKSPLSRDGTDPSLSSPRSHAPPTGVGTAHGVSRVGSVPGAPGGGVGGWGGGGGGGGPRPGPPPRASAAPPPPPPPRRAGGAPPGGVPP